MEKASSIKRELTYTYYLSKVLCLAPYSFSSNPVCEKCINTNFQANVTGFIWTLFMSVLLLTGLITGSYRYKVFGHSNPGMAVNSSLCFVLNSMNPLLSILVVFLKRHKFAELVEKLSEIDDGLCQIKLRNYSKCQNYFLYFLFIVCGLLAMFFIFDVLEVEETRFFINCSLYRLAYFISVVLIIQFCHIAICTQQRLFVLWKEMSSVLEKNRKHFVINFTSKPIFVEAVNKDELSSVAGVFPETENAVHDRNSCQSGSNSFLLPNKLSDVHKIITCRQIYSKIFDAVQLINSIYGLLLLLQLIRGTAGLVTNIYILASITISRDILPGFETWGTPVHIFSLVIWIPIFLSTVIAMTVTCQMVISESKKIGDIVQKLLLLQHMKWDEVQQLKLFSDQLTKNQIEFSALCLFKVDMSLLCTILASVISCIFILVQFK